MQKKIYPIVVTLQVEILEKLVTYIAGGLYLNSNVAHTATINFTTDTYWFIIPPTSHN